MRINEADVAELVDARDLKSLVDTTQEIDNTSETSDKVCTLAPTEPAEMAGNPACLQTIHGLNKVTSRGKRYVYLRGTDVALVRGFVGTEDELDALLAGPAVAKIVERYRARAAATIAGWRMDAARLLHRTAKARAILKEMPYRLSVAAINEMLIAAGDCCDLTAIRFDYGPKTNAEWMRRPMAPSLDRKNNAKGYTADNVRLVCTCVNIAVNEWGVENFARVCRAFVDHQKAVRA